MKTSWSAEKFARHLKGCCDTDDFRLAFFLGAGCSKTSGIPTAGELVRNRWLPKLKWEETGKSDGDVDEWASKAVEGYDPENPAMSYPKVIKECFPSHALQQREIERICKAPLPGFGYAVLTKLVEKEHKTFNTLITTNFDDLLADAFYLFTAERPLVILHEAFGGLISGVRTRPMIVKIHGDSKISPLNTTEELEKINPEIDIPVKNILTEMGLVFIGYGGNDKGIAKMLSELPSQAKRQPVYWIGSKKPEGVIKEWLDSREAIFVESAGFDEAMLFISNEFELKLDDKSRFENVYMSVEETFKKLNSKIEKMDDTQPGSSELKKAAKATAKSLPDWMQIIMDAERFKKSDPNRAEDIYWIGIEKLPNSVHLISSFALFLETIRKDYDRAEENYKRGIATDPNYANILGNYALFLEKVRKETDSAEEYYERAIATDPNHANNLGNYATFLTKVRKETDRAERLYKRAIEVDPNHANHLGNYAAFLTKERRDSDNSEGYFIRAIEADPNHAINLGGYANFLCDQRKEFSRAEEYYKRAIEADPINAAHLGNYANLLYENRKDYDRAEEYYKRAIEADPVNTHHLGNYALFLNENRKDYDRAEQYYKRAIEADPNYAINLDNFAIFLWRIRKDYNRAEEYYKRAIEADPIDTGTLGNYASFLEKERKEFDRAEEYYKRAIEADPNFIINLGNYAGFLLANGEREEGLGFLEKCKTLPEFAETEDLQIEVLFYEFANGDTKKRIKVLKEIKNLIYKGVRSEGWGFSRNISRAKKDKHTEEKWLEPLADVISGKTTPKALDKWKMWKEA